MTTTTNSPMGAIREDLHVRIHNSNTILLNNYMHPCVDGTPPPHLVQANLRDASGGAGRHPPQLKLLPRGDG